ncbi:MAG: hypothetical protein WA294_06105 [Acidobacteriaceae bacterium]
MKRLGILGMTLMALFALGAMTTSIASASLPELNLLPGEEFPITMEGTGKGAKLESVGGNAVLCTGFRWRLEQRATGSLGFWVKVFTGCKEGMLPCKTAGAAAEEVVIPEGEYHWSSCRHKLGQACCS